MISKAAECDPRRGASCGEPAFAGLSGGYGAILADPPWSFKTYSAKGINAKGAAGQYGCMSTADIAALPVRQLAAPDCALFMWGTFPMMPDAIDLMRAWGFTYKSGGAWGKQSKTGAKIAFGTGYIFRSAAEFFIVGTIGKPKVKSRSVRNLILSPVREHSRKPDDQYSMVESLFDGPYCELFARQRHPGWDAWGNETDKFPAPTPFRGAGTRRGETPMSSPGTLQHPPHQHTDADRTAGSFVLSHEAQNG